MQIDIFQRRECTGGSLVRLVQPFDADDFRSHQNILLIVGLLVVCGLPASASPSTS